MKIGLIMLAASTALAPAAMAQTVPDPSPYTGVTNVALGLSTAGAAAASRGGGHRMGSGAGHSWGGGGMRMHHSAPRMQHHSRPSNMGHGGSHMRMRHGGSHMRMGHGSSHFGSSSHKGGHRFNHFRRIDRGGKIPHHWSASRFHVRDWNLYGFPQPFDGGYWIRYYDDALLVDRYGRVHDGRYGFDWDRYGDDWTYDDDGVPVYSGDDDLDRDDYDRVDEYDRVEERGPEEYREEYRDDRDGSYHSRVYSYPGYAYPGYAYPGYGYGYTGAPVLVTETIVTTAPVVESVTHYEYIHERAKPHGKYRKAIRRAPPPPPPPPPPLDGERG